MVVGLILNICLGDGFVLGNFIINKCREKFELIDIGVILFKEKEVYSKSGIFLFYNE